MGIAEIEAKILEEAELEAERIKRKAESEAHQIETKAEHQIKELQQKIKTESQKKAEEVKRSILTPAHLFAKKRLLLEKHKILDEVFAGAKEEVRENKLIEVAKVLYG